MSELVTGLNIFKLDVSSARQKEVGQQQTTVDDCCSELNNHKDFLAGRGYNPTEISWSDTGRAEGSMFGPNITDVRLKELKPTGSNLTSNNIGKPITMVRTSNLMDELGVRASDKIKIPMPKQLYKDYVRRNGTLDEFIRNIGHYIPDLDHLCENGLMKGNDTENVMEAHQLQIVPGDIDVCPQIFDYNKGANLHIIIGPEGKMGYGISTGGPFDICFIENGQKKSIRIANAAGSSNQDTTQSLGLDSLLKSFSKLFMMGDACETNQLIHIQIPLQLPQQNFASYFSDDEEEVPVFRSLSALSEARVEVGNLAGELDDTNKMTNQVLRDQQEGTAIRVTNLFWLTYDKNKGQITEQELTRFLEKMESKRSAYFGSLVFPELHNTFPNGIPLIQLDDTQTIFKYNNFNTPVAVEIQPERNPFEIRDVVSIQRLFEEESSIDWEAVQIPEERTTTIVLPTLTGQPALTLTNMGNNVIVIQNPNPNADDALVLGVEVSPMIIS